MPLVIEPICHPVTVAEGPMWDEESQVLFFLDIYSHTIHSYCPQTKKHNSVVVETGGKRTSCIVRVKEEKNKFLIAVERNLAVISWDGVSSKPLVPEVLLEVDSERITFGLNDGKCDPSNRFWIGTMGRPLEGRPFEFDLEKGALYSMQKDKTIVKHLSKISLSNGLAWSLDKRKMFYNDSFKYKVTSYDYDDATGRISNEKSVFCLKEHNIEGVPDGMTIDQEGMLWVACFGGGQVLRINPNTGELIQTLKIPSPQTTSVVFGGPNFDHLFVTSAKVHLTKEEEDQYPLAGHVFKVTGLGVRGTPSLPVSL